MILAENWSPGKIKKISRGHVLSQEPKSSVHDPDLRQVIRATPETLNPGTQRNEHREPMLFELEHEIRPRCIASNSGQIVTEMGKDIG